MSGNNKLVSAQQAAMLVGQKAQTIVPMLIQATREVDPQKQFGKMITIFRKVDVKMSELEIHAKVESENVVKRELVECEMTIPKSQYDAMIKAGYSEDYMKRSFCMKVVSNTEKSRLINHLIKHIGIEETAAIVRLLIVNLNESFNVKNPLKLEQIYECAELIIEKYGDRLYIDELIYIFKRAKMEARTYDHLSGNMIYSYIDGFFEGLERRKNENHIENKTKDFNVPDIQNSLFPHVQDKMMEDYKKNFINITDSEKESKAKKK